MGTSLHRIFSFLTVHILISSFSTVQIPVRLCHFNCTIFLLAFLYGPALYKLFILDCMITLCSKFYSPPTHKMYLFNCTNALFIIFYSSLAYKILIFSNKQAQSPHIKAKKLRHITSPELSVFKSLYSTKKSST